MPVVGFINAGSADASPGRVAAFRKGLREAGYGEGQNVIVEYRWLEGGWGAQRKRSPCTRRGA